MEIKCDLCPHVSKSYKEAYYHLLNHAMKQGKPQRKGKPITVKGETGTYQVWPRTMTKERVEIKPYKRRAKGGVRKSVTVRGHYRSLPNRG